MNFDELKNEAEVVEVSTQLSVTGGWPPYYFDVDWDDWD